MHFGIKCICNILLVQKCIFAKQNVMQKCIFAQHLCFLQSKKHSIFAQLNIFLWKMYAEHFPKENVRKNAFLHQMHFGIKCILASNAFWHQMHFCTAKMHFGIKCILASNAFLHQQNVRIFVFCKAKNTAFLHSIKYIFARHSHHLDK